MKILLPVVDRYNGYSIHKGRAVGNSPARYYLTKDNDFVMVDGNNTLSFASLKEARVYIGKPLSVDTKPTLPKKAYPQYTGTSRK